MNATPATTKDTTSVEPASMAEGATTVKPEALEPWAGDEARCECDMALDKGMTRGACGADDTAPRESPIDGEQALEVLLREATTVDGHKLKL